MQIWPARRFGSRFSSVQSQFDSLDLNSDPVKSDSLDRKTDLAKHKRLGSDPNPAKLYSLDPESEPTRPENPDADPLKYRLDKQQFQKENRMN